MCAGDIDLPGDAHALPSVTWGHTCITDFRNKRIKQKYKAYLKI